MSEAKDTLKTILKQHHYSVTKQRLLVFNLMVDQDSLTMNELIKRSAGRLDKVSIYRNIALFEKLGIVQRLNIGWRYKFELTDKFSDHHHHLSCKRCGKVIEINEHALEAFIQQVADQNKFYAEEHQVEVQGLCFACKNKPSP
jgi:Fur family transcriptional regulator, ferric uptake regulator